jgi:hypothetical protein
MYIQEMIEKDPQYVIGLTVTIPFNACDSVTGVIKFAEKRNYSWTVDDGKTDVPRYLVSFDGDKFYTADRFVTGYED